MPLVCAVLLAVSGPAVPGGERSFGEAAELARRLAWDDRDDGIDGRYAAVTDLESLEWAAVKACHGPEPPGWRGPPAELVAVLELTAENRLSRVLPADLIAELRADRERCLAAGPAGNASADPRLRAVRDGLPALAGELDRCPGAAGVILAALALPDPPVSVEVTEPMKGPNGSFAAPSWCDSSEDSPRIMLSSALTTSDAWPSAFHALTFEAFNVQTGPADRRLQAATLAGTLGRRDCVWASVAVEELAEAALRRVYLAHAVELRAAGPVGAAWRWNFRPGRAVRHLRDRPPPRVRSDGYPYGVFGSYWDTTRLHAVSEPNGDWWEAAVLLDRLEIAGPTPGRNADYVRAMRNYVDRAGPVSVWYRVHAALPRELRADLAARPGGAELAAADLPARAADWAAALLPPAPGE